MAKLKFETEVLGEGPGKAWSYIKVPPELSDKLGTRGRVPVRGTLNGFAFRSSLMPDGSGSFVMMFNKAMQAGADAQQGDVVKVVLERDDAPREVAVPAELAAALEKAGLRATFDKLSPSCRKEYADWIGEAKTEATRLRRVEKALPMIAEKKRLK